MSTTISEEGSCPVSLEEESRGSSVSSCFVNEYEELLKYAIVAPKIGMQENVYKEKDAQVPILGEEGSSGTALSVPSQSDFRIADGDASSTDFQSNINHSRIVEAKKTVEKSKERLNRLADTPVKQTVDQSNQLSDSNGSIQSTPDNSSHSTSVDKDLIRMDGLLDDWLLQLKRNVLSEMADIKMRQFQNEENSVHCLKEKHRVETLKLTHEVENMKELLYTFEKNVKQKDDVITNMTEAFNKQKEKCDKMLLFSTWKMKHANEQRQTFATKMAQKYYNRIICSKVWTAWRSVVENKWKLRVEKACQIKSQEVCLKLTQDYEERLQALQQELVSTRREIANLHQEREFYEENMKKAFMRGVCALNMEAMSMFKEGKPNENEDVPLSGKPHHPCCVSDTDPVNSKITSSATDQRTTCDSTLLNEGLNTIRKKVSFGTIQHESATSKLKPNIGKFQINRGKVLHAKITGKKELAAVRNSNFRQSTISSIKVERHLPNESSSTIHINNKLKNESMFDKKTSNVPTIKVVD